MSRKVAIECYRHYQKIAWAWRFIVFNIFLWSSISAAFGQTDQYDTWKSLLNQYQSGEINDTLYLHRTRKLVGQFFKDTSLRE